MYGRDLKENELYILKSTFGLSIEQLVKIDNELYLKTIKNITTNWDTGCSVHISNDREYNIRLITDLEKIKYL